MNVFSKFVYDKLFRTYLEPAGWSLWVNKQRLLLLEMNKFSIMYIACPSVEKFKTVYINIQLL